MKSSHRSEMLKGCDTVIYRIYSDPERNEKTLFAIRVREKRQRETERARERESERDTYLLRGTQEMRIFY